MRGLEAHRGPASAPRLGQLGGREQRRADRADGRIVEREGRVEEAALAVQIERRRGLARQRKPGAVEQSAQTPAGCRP